MKKTVRILAVVMSVLMLCLCLASCGGGGLSGTYSASEYGTKIAFDFSGKNVEMTVSAGGLSYSVEGKYEIEDDKITFSFDEPDEDASYLENMLEGFESSLDFEKGDGYIKIEGQKFEKE
ncbi:MAG: hypothetical protein IKA76_06000 [Clostridia bacterium]|nr:hypothetical protein [Clostridia bacterium]